MRWQIPKTGPAANSARLPCQEREEDNKTPSAWRAHPSSTRQEGGLLSGPLGLAQSGWSPGRLKAGVPTSSLLPAKKHLTSLCRSHKTLCQTEGGSFLLNGAQVVLRQLEPLPPQLAWPSVCGRAGFPALFPGFICLLWIRKACATLSPCFCPVSTPAPPGWERPDVCRRPLPSPVNCRQPRHPGSSSVKWGADSCLMQWL